MTDYASQISSCEQRISEIGLRRDDEAVAVRQRVTSMISRIPLGAENERRARLLMDIAAQILRVGESLFRGIEPVAYALNLARQSSHDALLKDALILQGVMLTFLDNIHDASVCFEEAWEIASRLTGKDNSKIVLLTNFGCALHQAFMYSDALTVWSLAEEMAINSADKMWHGRILCVMANSALDAHQFEDGLHRIRQSIELQGEPISTFGKIARAGSEALYARLLLEVDRLPQAKEHAALAQKYAAQSGSALAELYALCAQGMVAVYTGEREPGRIKLLSALERGRAVPALMPTVLLGAIAAFVRLGEPAEALAYHREFSLMIERQKRSNSVRYTDRRIIAPSEEPFQLATAAAQEYGSKLRRDYINSAADKTDGGEAYLLAQAISAEADWDGDGEHLYRVGELAAKLAQALGLDELACHRIEMAARLHDLGMLAVPRVVKMKQWSLSATETLEIQKHCVDGAELVARSGLPYRSVAEDVIRHHHERWDGGGYPDGLVGAGIPLAARIVALTDAFDSMTHPRVYKEPLNADAALVEIQRECGTQFDPHAGAVFIEIAMQLYSERRALA